MAAGDEESESSRAETDKSLKDERAKTDAHLEIGHKEVERHTTDAIEDDRRIADEHQALEREARDRQVPDGLERRSKGNESLVMAERGHSDHAISVERARQDSDLRRERQEKQLVAEALLATERQRTDTDLGHERECVDLAFEQVRQQFKDEQTREVRLRTEGADREQAMALICHDLKNQAVTITIGAQLLRKRLSKDSWDRADAVRQVTSLEDNAAFLSRMVDSLLDIERFAHGKVVLNVKLVDLRVLLQDTAKLFSPVAITKSCTLLTDLGPKPLLVSADYDRLLQTVSNLVGNALKFTPSGGTISLAAKQDQSRATVSVTDTGPGIAEADRPKLFRKFSQLNNAEGGLGLGLYIAKSIVEAQGGTIGVDSTLGQGSSFRFTLALAPISGLEKA